MAARLPERGEVVGRYMVLDPIGRGAMGAVFAAYDPELDRKVALKLLLDDDPRARQRMQREAQALARVTHPNVITIHDVGADGSRAFIAMELIIGGRTLATSNEQLRPWRETLALYVAAGHGLAAAHAAGLVHRDFKPANVLIAGDGRVLVTDFGLARRVDPSSGAPLMLTPGPHGTPAYMAPERVVTDTIDVRADQFSFCVALFEALFGQRPFAAATVAESTVNAALGLARIPKGGDVPRWLRRIVMRGLVVDPTKRWASMDALLAAIAAAQRRVSRRNAGIVAGVIVGAVAAIYALVPTPDRCANESSLAGIWDDTRSAALAPVFAASGRPYASDVLDRVRVGLDAHAAALATGLRDVCTTGPGAGLGEEGYHRKMACLSGQRDELRALVDVLAEADQTVVDRAIVVIEQLRSPHECENAASRASIVLDAAIVPEEREILGRARALQTLGKYDEALALATDLAAHSSSAVARGRATFSRGTATQRLGRFAEAEQLLFDAFVGCEQNGDDETAAQAASWLVTVIGSDLGRPDEGLRWSTVATAVAERAGTIERSAATIEGNLALLDWHRGDFSAAEAHVLRAIEIHDARNDLDTVEVGLMYMNVGAIRGQQKDIAGAREWLERAVAVLRDRLPAAHPDVAIAMGNLAQAMFLEGESAAAAEVYEQVLAEQRVAYGTDHIDVARIEHSYSAVLTKLGRLREARELVVHALPVFERVQGRNHPMVVRCLTQLGLIDLELGDTATAIVLGEQAVAIVTKTSLGPEADGEAHFLLADALRRAGKEPARSRTEAALARASFAKEPWLADRVGDVDRWSATDPLTE